MDVLESRVSLYLYQELIGVSRTQTGEKRGSDTRVLCHRVQEEAAMLLRAMLFEACAVLVPRIAHHVATFRQNRGRNYPENAISGYVRLRF